MKHLIILLLSVVSLTSLTAQKFGFVNSTEILAQHPQVKSADSELEAYQRQLVAKGETMVTAFEKKYNDYLGQANAGTLSAVQMQQKEEELSKEQQTIQTYEIEVQNKILKKREELYQPILDNINNVLTQMGKDGGYTMIFDASGGALLYANDAEDLTSQLRTKLGF